MLGHRTFITHYLLLITYYLMPFGYLRAVKSTHPKNQHTAIPGVVGEVDRAEVETTPS